MEIHIFTKERMIDCHLHVRRNSSYFMVCVVMRKEVSPSLATLNKTIATQDQDRKQKSTNILCVRRRQSNMSAELWTSSPNDARIALSPVAREDVNSRALNDWHPVEQALVVNPET